MDRATFNELSFEEVINQLTSETNTITTKDDLKSYIQDLIIEDDLITALHILEAIVKDPIDYEYYDYDYSMGTLDKPAGISGKEDLEHLIYD